MPEITGCNFIGSASSRAGSTFRVTSRLTSEELAGEFANATADEVVNAAVAAKLAFPQYAQIVPEQKASFLDATAGELLSLGDELLERAHHESGLPIARLTGERGRTCGQLKMFAQLVRDGTWQDVRIDAADSTRTPPKPELRRLLVPIGPVAVFGASNFPLAFSVAGGDTASALAAGCPVIVKAHPAHPGTSELAAQAILAAAQKTGMPDGAFSMVHGGAEQGMALALRPEIYAVGFTGSKAAGRALFDVAAVRSRPIPVFAEMGSVNPVFLLQGALEERGETVAKGYAESLTLGVGQFCTNPGVVVGLRSAAFERFLDLVAGHLAEVSPGTMLTCQIEERYRESVEAWSRHHLLRPIAPHRGTSTPALFATSGASFLCDPDLAEEVFGPAAVAVECESEEEMLRVAEALEGQLTATIHMAEADGRAAEKLVPVLTRVAGRIVFNGFPTGVEVSPAMQHGGPYPASTDSRFTSVGTAAILRFARPVAFQNAPENLLPEALR